MNDAYERLRKLAVTRDGGYFFLPLRIVTDLRCSASQDQLQTELQTVTSAKAETITPS